MINPVTQSEYLNSGGFEVVSEYPYCAYPRRTGVLMEGSSLEPVVGEGRSFPKIESDEEEQARRVALDHLQFRAAELRAELQAMGFYLSPISVQLKSLRGNR